MKASMLAGGFSTWLDPPRLGAFRRPSHFVRAAGVVGLAFAACGHEEDVPQIDPKTQPIPEPLAENPR